MMDIINKDALPNGWVQTKLGDFVIKEKGKKPKNQSSLQSSEYHYPYIDIEAFEKKVFKSWADGKGCNFCSENDFLMVWDGSRSGLVGKGISGALGSTLMRIQFPLMDNNYAYYFLQSKFLEINTRAKGSGTPHVDPDLLWNYDFFIPPLNEQKRIVAKIETLFSALDKGIENLQKAQKQLKIYRQSLLKHAFEGKLTAKWRTENADKLVSAEELLKQIKQEKENHYQKQLNDYQENLKQWEQNGKEGKRPNKPRSIIFSEIINENIWTKQSMIPENWCWTNLKSISDQVSDGDHQAPPQSLTGIPFIVISNIKNNQINFSDTKFVPEEYYNNLAISRKPINGDILFTVTGSFGIPVLINTDIKFCFQRHIALIRLNKLVNKKYLFYFLLSYFCFLQAKTVATGTAQKTVPLEGLREFTIPMPCILEQQVIVSLLEEKLSVVEQLEKDIIQNLKRAETLRQSILKKAFSGKLVPQDPNDEPASILLERIKAEKGVGKTKAIKNKIAKA